MRIANCQALLAAYNFSLDTNLPLNSEKKAEEMVMEGQWSDEAQVLMTQKSSPQQK